jgi:hypothetical protein
MQFVYGYRCETALKQMPRLAATCMDEIGVAAMCFAHGTAEPIGLSRIQDQVHVVWHQAVSPDFHIRLARLFPKKIAVNLLIAVCKENRFSTIATLRHVMRETGYHHAGQTRHERKITTNQNRGE